jgi:YHS domain-containing protein
MPLSRALTTLCLCFIVFGFAATATIAEPDPLDVATERIGELYLLENCPVSGGEIGGMGEPFVKIYDGREIRFCCDMCLPEFERDLQASFARVDEQIIASQLPFYPTTACVVSDEALHGENGEDEPIDIVYNNRLVRLCCSMCRSKFAEDPFAYIAKLDEEVLAQQDDLYPFDICLISGKQLVDDSIDLVYGGRLVKFCCVGCIIQFEADPLPTINKIDSAWMAMHGSHGDDIDG